MSDKKWEELQEKMETMFGKKYYQNNEDLLNKLEDVSMNKFRFLEREINREPKRDEYGQMKYKEITERAKAFNDWKEYIENKRKKLKNTEKNSTATNSFLERFIADRSTDKPELSGIIKEINKNKINKHIAERSLGKKIKGKEWNTLSKEDRKIKISELEKISNPTKRQKQINDLINDYQTAHIKQLNFNNELQKRISQPGFEFLRFK